MATNDTNRVYQEIEASADYYPPEVYDELSFMVQKALSYQSEGETWDTTYVPVTMVRTPPNAKMFVVGVLPPSCNVTGRYLDRTASLTRILGIGDKVDVENGWGGVSEGAGGGVTGQDAGNKYGPIVTAPGYTLQGGSGNAASGGAWGGVTPTASGEAPNIKKPAISERWGSIYAAYKSKFGREPTLCEMQIYTAQSTIETGGGIPNNNPGCIGNKPAYNDKGEKIPPPKEGDWYYWAPTKAYFKTYPTAQDGFNDYVHHITRNPNAVQAAQNCDVLGYLTSQAQTNYFGESMSQYYAGCYTTGEGGLAAAEKCRNGRPDGFNGGYRGALSTVAHGMSKSGVQLDDGTKLPKNVPWACAYIEDTSHYQARVEPNVKARKSGQSKKLVGKAYRFGSQSPYGDECGLTGEQAESLGSDAPSVTWVTNGSANAMQAEVALAKNANKGMSAAQLNNKFMAAQQRIIQETVKALEKMRNTPPLRMLVNPRSFKVASEKVIQDGSWTQVGPVIQHWGENQDKIEGSGQIAGFYASDINAVDTPGLSRVARNMSKSYQNFMSLWLLYRNNGALHVDVAQGPGDNKIRSLSVLGSIYLYYDNTLYIGSFDSFNITESDDKPFTLEYTFSFTVRATFLLDAVRDPQHTYGQPQPPLQMTESQNAGTTAELPENLQVVMTQEQINERRAEREAVDFLNLTPGQVMGASTPTRGELEIDPDLKAISPYIKTSDQTPAPGKPNKNFR